MTDYFGDGTKSRINICDIDGTIATHPQRGHHDYAKVGTDLPVTKIIELVEYLDIILPISETVFVTGRPEKCREDTEAWLKEHVPTFLNTDTPLLMRKDGDYRGDDIVKREIYEDYIEPYCEVMYVIDDRNRVVKMWRELGLTVLQVADGEF